MKHVDVSDLDYACDTPVLVLDLSVAGSGDVTASLVEYTYEANYDLIRTTSKKTGFLSGVSDETLRWIASYPDSMPCLETTEANRGR